MPRLHPEDFEGVELAPVALAGTMHEAGSIEAALDAGGMEYTVEITEYFQSLFGGTREGVVFLAPEADAGRARAMLEQAGLGGLLTE